MDKQIGVYYSFTVRAAQSTPAGSTIRTMRRVIVPGVGREGITRMRIKGARFR